eukprot:147047_1
MQSMVEILIHAAFITSILLQPIASSDDIIFYDEFLFHFDLLNENDWDQYHVQNNKPQETQNTFDYHGRRLIGQHNQHNDNDNQYASKCTNRIPVIFKHLCVHWDLINGFTFNYRSTLPQSTQNNYQTNWFYPSRSAKISSAKNAAKYYNILDGETWSMSDDKSWNEIDWISSLNHETPSDDVFKQCRTNKAIEECAHYDLHHKKLTFAIKVPKGRYKRHTPSHHLSSPANIESFAAFAPQSIAMPFDIGSLGIDSNALFPPRGDFESIKGPMDGLDMSNMNAPPFADNQVFTNDLRDETASRMMQMIGFNDPMNVRRRMYEDDGIYYEKYFYHWPPRAVVFGPAQQSRSASNAFAPPITGAVGSHGGMASGVGAMFGMAIPGSSSTIDMNEIGKLTNLEDSNPDLTIQSAEQMMKWTGHDDPWNIRRRLYGEDGEDAMTYDYMDDIQNGYDFTAPFEYGDMLGYRLWAKDKMAVNEFECLNCDEEDVFGAHVVENDEELNQASDYSLYGDFMYYFDEHLFDFANDEDWKSNNGDLSKCSVAIPGLHHKLCVDHDNGEYQVRFAAASSDEMDDTYYQLYGYDEYYYNTLAHQYMENYGDYDELRDEIHAFRQKQQLDSNEDYAFDDFFDVPRGYDQDEYGDGDNGYDEQHPMEGNEDPAAEQRRAQLDEMQAEHDDIMEQKAHAFERLTHLAHHLEQREEQRRRLVDYDDGTYTDYTNAMNDYYTQQYMDTQEILDNVQDELGDILLFERDTDWDEITDIHDRNEAFGYRLKAVNKCKVTQMMQICATMHLDHTGKGNMKIRIKLGRHKYHRLKHGSHSFQYDLNMDHAPQHTLQPMHWMMDHNIMDVKDNEWNDGSQTSHHYTYHGHHMARKCKGTFCLCQYVNYPEEGNLIHPCKPALKADKSEILGAGDLLNLVNVMDAFLAPIHVLHHIHPMPPPHKTNHVLQRLPYAHILHLRAFPQRMMFIHPFQSHTFHNPIGYRKSHVHRIPWHLYRPYAMVMPLQKPSWLPQWIWMEVQHNMKQLSNAKAASIDMDDYYDYGDADTHNDQETEEEIEEIKHMADQFQQYYDALRKTARGDDAAMAEQYGHILDDYTTRRRLPFTRPTLQRKRSARTSGARTTKRTPTRTGGTATPKRSWKMPSFKRSTSTPNGGATKSKHNIFRRKSTAQTKGQTPPKQTTRRNIFQRRSRQAPQTQTALHTRTVTHTPPVHKPPPVVKAQARATVAKPQTPQTPPKTLPAAQGAKQTAVVPVVKAQPVTATKPQPAPPLTYAQAAKSQTHAVPVQSTKPQTNAAPVAVKHDPDVVSRSQNVQSTQVNEPQVEHPHLAALLHHATEAFQHAGGVQGITKSLNDVGIDADLIKGAVLQAAQDRVAQRSGIQLPPGAFQQYEKQMQENRQAVRTAQLQGDGTTETRTAQTQVQPQIQTVPVVQPQTQTQTVPSQPQTAVAQPQAVVTATQPQAHTATGSVPQTVIAQPQIQTVKTVAQSQPQTVVTATQPQQSVLVPAQSVKPQTVTAVAPAQTHAVVQTQPQQVVPVTVTQPQQTMIGPQLPPKTAAHHMLNNYNQYSVYDNEQEEDDDAFDDDLADQILDGWYDEYDDNEWVVMDDADDAFVADTIDLLDFEDDSIWDEIMMNIETLKGRPLAKKCMNLFGRTLCICEFMDWLNGKIIGGNTKHICYSSAHKESAITKKTMKQIQTVAKQKRKAKESKALKQEVVLGKALQKEQKEVQSLKKKETETKEQNKDLKKKEVHLKKEIQAKQKKENKAKEQNKELKKKEQHLKKEIETKKQKEVKAKEQNKDLKKKEQHLKKEIQTEKHKETKAKKETKQLKKKEDDLKKTLKKKIVQQKKKETVLEKELQKKVVQQKTSVHKKQVIEKNIVLKKTEKPVSPKHKALQKERDDLKKEIAKTVQEHSELKQKNKKIAVNTLRLNRMAQTKVTKGHQHIMKEHHVLMKQMKQLHHLMKKVRSQKNAALPHRRPIWLPHYFWHWLHHFPHFHELHLRHKMPWISSAAHIDEDEEHAFNGGMEMDDNDYAYGSEYDDAYDEWVEAAENYAKAYLEYNAALAGYDEDDAFVKAAENYAQAYLEYDDALDGFAYNGEDYDVDEMVEYILSGKEENEDYYYDDANDDDEMGTENEYVYEEEDDQYEEEQNEYAYDDDKALTYDDDTDETYGYDDLYNDEYEQYTDEGDHNYDEDSEYASNMDDYYVGEDGMSAWTMDDNDYHNDVNEEYDEFEYEYESHSDYSDAEDEESDEDGDALIAALAQSANDGTNPYWVFELIFLALCGFGVICAVIYVQKQEWIETIREMNRQRINSRKYGFNRINVVFDTEDTGSDDSDWGHHVPIANKMMDMDHDLSGDEHLGSSHESPINESEIHNMIQ